MVSGKLLINPYKFCSDIDECSDKTDGCSGSCTNTPGSFVCSCPPGKSLGSNGKSCHGKIKYNSTDATAPVTDVDPDPTVFVDSDMNRMY